MIAEQLQTLEAFLRELCSPCGSTFKLAIDDDRVAHLACQYEGYARILKGLLLKKKNVARLHQLGYEKLVIRLAEREKPIAIVRVFDFLL